MKKFTVVMMAVVVMSFLNVSNVFALMAISLNGKIIAPTEKLAQYTTTFNIKKTSRTKNLQLAAKAFNGLVIFPDEIISFNEIVGPRTLERGFLKAGSFVNGQVVSSVGGGICQVASTISAAVIKYGLEIKERHRHSAPISYVSSENEATVAYGQKDFRFRNNTKNILYVKCVINKNKVYVELWRCS